MKEHLFLCQVHRDVPENRLANMKYYHNPLLDRSCYQGLHQILNFHNLLCFSYFCNIINSSNNWRVFYTKNLLMDLPFFYSILLTIVLCDTLSEFISVECFEKRSLEFEKHVFKIKKLCLFY